MASQSEAYIGSRKCIAKAPHSHVVSQPRQTSTFGQRVRKYLKRKAGFIGTKNCQLRMLMLLTCGIDIYLVEGARQG